jgi:hypothetical protein
MTRNEALAIARSNRAAYIKAEIEFMFGRGPAVSNDAFGTSGKGWFHAGEFNFSEDEITGEQYDFTQGGLAYL